MKNRFLFSFFVFVTLFSSVSVFADDKSTIANIISNHLESIGTKEKRAATKNQVILCTLQFSSRANATILGGNGVFVSEGNKNVMGMKLNSADYPQDTFSFDGDKVRVAYLKPGVYSVLGEFLFNYRDLLKEGLLGGTLFSSWTMNNVDSRKAKLSYGGIKKINGAEAHLIEVNPKGGIDLDIKMFFDTKSFRHVRTEYSKFIAARQAASIDNSAGQSPDRMQLTEEFSEFQNMDGLNLPGKYTLTYNYYNNSPIQSRATPNREVTWKFKVANFSFNQQLDPNSFVIDLN